MKNIVLFSSLLSFLFLPLFSTAQRAENDSLSLSKAISLATNNQPLLREAEDYVKVAQGRIRQSESSKYPQISAALSFDYMGPIPSIVIPFGPGGRFDLAPAYNYNEHIDVKYLIFDFNRRNEWINLLKSNKLAEQEKINLLKNRLAYQTVQAFYSVLFLRKSLKVKDEQTKDLLRHLATAKKLVETGSAISLDTLTTHVRVTAIENQKAGIENLLLQNEIALKSLLNLNNKTNVHLTGGFVTSVPKMPLDSLIEVAFANREEIKLNKIGEQAANIQKNIANISKKPTLSAIGSYGLKNGYPDALYKMRSNWLLGVAANIPIFDGYMKKAKVETANWNVHAVQNKLDALRKTISREVQQAESELLSSQKQLKMAREEIISAQAAVKQARVQYKSGYVTNLSLLDAETSLTRARLSYVAGLYKITLNKYRLMETMGLRIW
ncbi:MAG TPA: TolC family protein [Bacteroidetes bacterium]|nr:TolC family protein [Bacteroidota bacterium]